MKTPSVEDELFHADGHDEANSRFSQFFRTRLNEDKTKLSNVFQTLNEDSYIPS